MKALIQMYKTFVRPHIEYCDILFHSPPILNLPPIGVSLTSLMSKIESIQYQAALAITGTWKGTSRSKIYEEIGLESLSDRRLCRRLIQLYKIVNKQTPLYLYNILPPNRRNLLPLPYIFQEIRCRTDRYKSSFFPDAISSWNSIISHFETFPSLSELKRHLFLLFRPAPRSIFGIHNPTGIHNIFQLRVGLTHLRSHKKKHNFLDTPSDRCICLQGVEDTKHFLLSCPLFAHHRETLVTDVGRILARNNIVINDHVHLYLYGDTSLNDADNKNILLATISFII